MGPPYKIDIRPLFPRPKRVRYSSPPDRRNGARRLLGQISVTLACLTLTTYFAYHIRYGRHGFEVRSRLTERSALLDFEIKGLETVRTKLRHDVALLSPELPNSDIVEETARDVLGYVRADDKIVAAR
jgi:cell division protein FtsB